MPVSPQDFELYSRMTGAPMPSDAMSRMKMAPDVYKFTKDFARKPNLLEKTGNLVKTVGKIGLMGLGEGYRQSQANEQRAIQESLRNSADKAEAESVTMENPVEEVISEPLTAGERLIDRKMKAKREEAEIDQKTRDDKQAKAKELLAIKSGNIQQSTTADAFGQDVSINQTKEGFLDKKIEQGAEIASEGDTVAKVLSEDQDSKPMFRPTQIPTVGAIQAATPVVGSGLSKAGNNVNVIKGVEEEEVGSGATSDKVENFLKKMGGMDEGSKLDVALLAAMQDRDKKERFYLGANSGDPALGNSPLIDHPDLPGGEDDINLPSGTNTSSTTNLEDHYGDMRRMEAQERIKRKSPSEKQIDLLEQRAIDNQEAIDSGFMNLDDAGRKKESIRLGSKFGIPNSTDMAEIRKDPEFIAAQESMKPKSTAEKTDDYLKQVMEDLNDPDAMMDKPEISYKTSRAGRQEVGLTQGGDYFEVYKNNPQKTYITRLEPTESEAFEAMAGSEINDDKEKRPDASKFLDHFKNLRQQEQL